MAEIVTAEFEDPGHAERAVHDLENYGVPESAIQQDETNVTVDVAHAHIRRSEVIEILESHHGELDGQRHWWGAARDTLVGGSP